MIIEAQNLGKRFNREWIFRNFNYKFLKQNGYAIIGPNGSGKSTLLQVISGFIPPSEGKIGIHHSFEIPLEEAYKYISFVSPYQELPEELTLDELVSFHNKFRKFENNLSIEELVSKLSLKTAIDKPIHYFSSGMKQRIKLGLALYSESEILLLDEPTVNLDSAGISWYMEEIGLQLRNKTLIICSNQPYEYECCNHEINILGLR